MCQIWACSDFKILSNIWDPVPGNKQQNIYTVFKIGWDVACFEHLSINQVCLVYFFFVIAFRTIENTQGDTRSFWKIMEFPFHYVKCDGIQRALTGPLSSLDNSIHICYTCGFLLAFWWVSCWWWHLLLSFVWLSSKPLPRIHQNKCWHLWWVSFSSNTMSRW